MIQIVRSSEVFRKLKRRTGSVVLAVSGGIDSTSMLYMFNKFHRCKEVLFDPVVAHVQHDVREEGPEEDREFVRSLAEQFGMTFRCRPVNVREAAERESASMEAVARRKRYDALRQICRSVNAGTLVTAHHRADQIQTILMRLWRGTGLQGLCGIRAIRSIRKPETDQTRTHGSNHAECTAETGSIQLIRPMLEVPKQTIQAYVKKHDLTWREDPSNKNLKYHRNLVRERLIPRVKDVLQDSYPELLLRLQARADQLDRSLREAWSRKDVEFHRYGHDLMVLRSDVERCERMLYPYLLRRIKQSLSLPKSVRYHDFHRFQELIREGETGRQEVLSGGVLLRLEHRYLVAQNTSRSGRSNRIGSVVLTLPGKAQWMGYSFDGKPVYDRELSEQYTNGAWSEFIDVSCVEGSLRISQRQPGDVMRPLGMSGHKKLKEMMIDQKIPRSVRDRWPVVRDEQGIIWVPGLRLSDRVRITDRTRAGRVFKLCCDGGEVLNVSCSDL